MKPYLNFMKESCIGKFYKKRLNSQVRYHDEAFSSSPDLILLKLEDIHYLYFDVLFFSLDPLEVFAL